MVKYGSLTNPAVEITEEIRRIGKGGFDYAEIGIEGPEGMPDILIKKKEKILKHLKKKDMFAIGHTAWWMEFASPYEEIRELWVKEAKKCVDTAKALGIELLNFHFNVPYTLYLTKPSAKRHVLDQMVKSMKDIVKYGKENKINIMLENTPQKEGKLEDYMYVIDNVPGLGAHLDIAHAFLSGGMEYTIKFVEYFGKGILHVHASDNDGLSDNHASIGDGRIDWKAVIKALKKIGYDRTVTFEVFTGEKDIVGSRKTFEKLWRKVK